MTIRLSQYCHKHDRKPRVVLTAVLVSCFVAALSLVPPARCENFNWDA
jgi:hypothetical protein